VLDALFRVQRRVTLSPFLRAFALLVAHWTGHQSGACLTCNRQSAKMSPSAMSAPPPSVVMATTVIPTIMMTMTVYEHEAICGAGRSQVDDWQSRSRQANGKDANRNQYYQKLLHQALLRLRPAGHDRILVISSLSLLIGSAPSFPITDQVPDAECDARAIRVSCDLLATPMGFPSGVLLRPHLGQIATSPRGDRETRDAPDQQREATNDQDSVMRRSAWTARRIIFQRTCGWTRWLDGSFVDISRKRIQDRD
jgi:hypothetical protein